MADQRFRYLGWSLGVTYQAQDPRGLGRDYAMRLLDEMAGHGMNVLDLMMISYAYFDPTHDGYAWPVRNPRLECYRDLSAVNADESTEFVGEVIAEADARDIEIRLFMNWGIWNPDRIRFGYPGAARQTNSQDEFESWLHCPDSPDAWQLGLDEIEDLLTRYDHPNVTGYGFERLGYARRGFCRCEDTQRAYQADTGQPMLEADEDEIIRWKTDRTTRRLKEYVDFVKRTKPGIQVGLHTCCVRHWGHDPAVMREIGVDYLLPHTIQFPTTREQLYATLDRLAPNRCILHFCVRSEELRNYPIWIKTPEIIQTVIGWIEQYPRDIVEGILFFNEAAVSTENRRAVYEQVARLR